MPYKTYCFALQKRSCQFLRELSLQKQGDYIVMAFGNTKKIVLLLKFCQSSFMPPFSYIHTRTERI